TDAVDDAVGTILADAGWEPLVEPLIAGLQDELAGVSSLEEAQAVIASHYARMGTEAFAQKLAEAMFAARMAGEADDALSDEA
ncbi:MAG: DUF935 family protein, partial [Rhizobiales bacterium]|nr:DUF935 family protein [Hyphomicrobiales bacterium]